MLEDVFIFPFVLLGRALATKNKLDEEFDIFFFFPFYHIGGAEKVHAQIASVFSDRKAVIFFTRKSHNDFFLRAFQLSGHRIVDISAATDNRWNYFNNLIYRGLVSKYINSQKKRPIVFNGQSNFGYKLSPWIRKEIPQIELIHSFNSFSYIRLPFLPFYDNTVMISRRRIADHIEQYRRWGVPAKYNGRIQYIVNGIPLPVYPVHKQWDHRLHVLYAGRATPEKRVHWIVALAERCAEEKIPVDFVFMGDVREALPVDKRTSGKFLGNVGDPDKIQDQYRKAHVLLLSSSTEGFPMVVEEAMAMGCAILATPVGDIPLHVAPGENGMLFSPSLTMDLFLKEGMEFIRILAEHRSLLQHLSKNNIEYAQAHFGLDAFSKAYRELFQKAAQP